MIPLGKETINQVRLRYGFDPLPGAEANKKVDELKALVRDMKKVISFYTESQSK